MSASLNQETAKDDATEFLARLAPGEPITFQTFDDASRVHRGLSRVLHGSLAEHFDALASLNARGAGVFVMVNEGDGKGRCERNVRRIRAYFADFDGTLPPDVGAQPLCPHCVIESSPGRWHWYWWIEGAPLGMFKAVQRALAGRYGSDPSICDLPRVMRLPGFLHCKSAPFRTRIVELRDAPHYSHADFVQVFGMDVTAAADRKVRQSAIGASVTRLPTAPGHPRALPGVIPEGIRNDTLLSLAAGLVRKGYYLQGVTDRLQRLNSERCMPPLCTREVDDIAARAVAYGSNGYRILSDALLDSPEWHALAPAAKCIIVVALRRFDGSNNGYIALPWTDFRDSNGFRNEGAFLRHRAACVRSGILIESRKGRHTQHGITPTLYAIAERFLRVSQPAQSAASATCTIRQPYIDRQSLGACDLAGVQDSRLPASGANLQRGTIR